MSEKKELSGLARQILSGGGHVTLFTQQEFDEALALGKAEIMQVAVQTTKQAIMIERQACAEVCKRLAEQESDGEVSTVLVNAAMAIQTRMLGQL
jgi:hypothetical protein